MDKEPERSLSNAIAIVGMSGRFPGARDVHEFWDNLSRGVESIRTFSAQEVEAAGLDPSMLSRPGYVNAKGLLADVELFDAGFFGFNAREAEITDPQHRVLLECAWEALEDAGYDPATYAGAIGVYAGAAMSTYLHNLYANPQLAGLVGHFQTMVANDKDHLTTRIAYKLNFRGPAVTVQTACSTSLVAVCLACESLLDCRCDMALAGGVSIQVPQEWGYFFQDGGIGSPDGHCRAFDADARGTVPGNGAGLVVLKRLSDALADGDTVRAIIRGTALNNDGSSKIGYTAPSVQGQAEVVALAQAMAGVPADTITYVEAHGTGTSVGDPIEITALAQAFGAQTQRKQFCAVGSVKTNVGHLDPAAGVTGLIKTVLALQHKHIPPSLHFRRPNPRINFADTPFYVNTEFAPWTNGTTPRRAGVSSFGIGGTNAHVVLEEAPSRPSVECASRYVVLPISARSRTALDRSSNNLATHLRVHQELDLADVSSTLRHGRRHFAHRRVVVARRDEREAAIRALERGDGVLAAMQTGAAANVAFVFPGQGAQHVDMGRGLYESERTFRDSVDRCAALLVPTLGTDLREVLFPSGLDQQSASERINRTVFTQPALFIIEHALAMLWLEWGVRPAALVGHSIGEYVAACLAGVMSLEDALSLVALRGQLMDRMPRGAMLAVGAAEEQIAPLLRDGLWMAAVNSPSTCIVSGTFEATEQFEQELARRAIGAQRLHTSHAFHSGMMDPVLAPFRDRLSRMRFNHPQIPMISNVTGDWADERIVTPDYWVDQLRRTVRFAAGLQRLFEPPRFTILEVGPGRTITQLASKPGVKRNDDIVPSMRHVHAQESDEAVLLTALARLWTRGAAEWRQFRPDEPLRRVPLPTYPFERQRYWIDRPRAVSTASVHALRRNELTDWLYVPEWRPADSRPIPLSERGMRWLVLDDQTHVGAQVIYALRGAGVDVIVVRPGDQFAHDADGHYTVRPNRREDFESLLSGLAASPPGRVVHLWSMAGGGLSEVRGRCDSSAGARVFGSLVALAQACGETTRLHIDVVTARALPVKGTDPVLAEQALALGPCRVIPQEYPGITCRHVDAEVPDASTGARIASEIVAELLSAPEVATVALSEGRRWVPAYVRVARSVTDTEPLRYKGGAFVITGAFGGIGHTLAAHLAQATRAPLVLVSRTSLPPRDAWDRWLTEHDAHDAISQRIGQTRALLNAGSAVTIESADVADGNRMDQVFADAIARHGCVAGIVHAAGVAGGGLIRFKTATEVDRVTRPKVAGGLVLEEIVGRHPVPFLLLCSSMASLVGGVGQVDYCAANAFLDSLAARISASGATRAISVDWDTWLEVGMAVRTPAPAGLEAQRASAVVHGIRPSEGAIVFDRLLRIGAPRVIVSTRDLDAVLASDHKTVSQSGAAQEQPAPIAEHERPTLAAAYVAPRTATEERIATVWQQLLGIDRVGVDDGFFDLGGHSLLAIQVVSRLRDAFAVDLSVESLFDSPTVAGLASVIDGLRSRETEDSDQIAELLSLVEGLSDDEVKSMLESRGGPVQEGT